MRLLLHIGTEKTGTTTLQRWFDRNRQALCKKGVWYPVSLGTSNHRHLSVFAGDSDKPEDGFFLRGIHSIEDHHAFRKQLIEDFSREYREKSHLQTWVISNEQLHSRLLNLGTVERTKEFLADRFDEIKVIIHLRPQVDVAVSLASTEAEYGTKITAKRFSGISDKSLYYHYEKLVGRWETVYGPENVIVIPFKRKPCITSFVIDLLGLDRQGLSEINRSNESLDWRTIAMMNAMLMPQLNQDNTVNINRQIFIEDFPRNEPLRIGLDLAKKVQAHFDPSNEDLVARRPDLELEDLQPDWRRYDAEPNVHLLDGECVFGEQLRYLVQRLNWQVKLERCSARLAECALALARNNRDGAGENFEHAKLILDMVPANKATNELRTHLVKRLDNLATAVAEARRT